MLDIKARITSRAWTTTKFMRGCFVSNMSSIRPKELDDSRVCACSTARTLPMAFLSASRASLSIASTWRWFLAMVDSWRSRGTISSTNSAVRTWCSISVRARLCCRKTCLSISSYQSANGSRLDTGSTVDSWKLTKFFHARTLIWHASLWEFSRWTKLWIAFTRGRKPHGDAQYRTERRSWWFLKASRSCWLTTSSLGWRRSWLGIMRHVMSRIFLSE